MEKAIEIKRRAQRCIQNGDLDGALNEYEKLVGSEDSDPYNYVLLADLLYKKGDQGAASERYMSAVGAYERASLFKNAIAVCKKMLRLSLSPARVLQSLGNLHALDGLSGEAALYYVQYAEHMVRASAPAEAAQALRQAFDVSQDNIRVLEQLSEAWLLAGENAHAAQALTEAACHYRDRGSEADARRCLDRATQLDPALGETPAPTAAAVPTSATTALTMPAEPAGELGPIPVFELDHRAVELPLNGDLPLNDDPPAARGETPAEPVEPMLVERAPIERAPVEQSRMDDLETGRHHPAPAYEPAETLELDGREEPEEDEETDPVEYVIEEEPEPVPFAIAPEEDPAAEPEEQEEVYEIAAEPEEQEAVYEIAADEVIPYEASVEETTPQEPQDEPQREPHVEPQDEPQDEPVYEIGEDSLSSPAEPGLSFTPPAAQSPEPTPEEQALAEVEQLLARAQEQFRAGDRDEASHTLTRAAQSYEAHERFENAATIYRSLGRGAHATPEILELWLGNCERRHDAREGASVACDLGDRALNDGDEQRAREWFERALALDGQSDTARRRLERLTRPEPEPAPVAVAATPAADEPAAESAPQRVEIAVGRAEAVNFDLQGLLAEFQRGVEEQLAGDAQSHYDLAMTYREMGLLDQAVGSFRNAGADARFAARATEMVARCLADQGRHADACIEFARALTIPGVSAENDIELHYHFGNALVELGRLEEAVPEYETVLQRMPDFEDATERLGALRRTLGQA